MKKRGWYLCVVSIAMAGMLPAVATGTGNCPDDPKVKKIAIAPDYNGGKITVSPKRETIYLGSGETVCWEVSGLRDGDWVEFKDTSKDTRDLQDPFKAASARLTIGNSHFKGVKPSNAAASHKWVYDVFVKYIDGGNTEVRMELDPEVVIKIGEGP